MTLPTIKQYDIKTLEDIQPAMLQVKEITTLAKTMEGDMRDIVKRLMVAEGIKQWKGMDDEFVITCTPDRVEEKVVQVSTLIETAKTRKLKERIEALEVKKQALVDQLEIEATYKSEKMTETKSVKGRFAIKWKK